MLDAFFKKILPNRFYRIIARPLVVKNIILDLFGAGVVLLRLKFVCFSLKK